jgi:hypothetical protein
MLIDPNTFNSFAETADGSALFDRLLLQAKQNENRIIANQNPFDINNFNMGTGYLGYLFGESSYPESGYPQDLGIPFGFRPSPPPTIAQLKNGMTIYGGFPTA